MWNQRRKNTQTQAQVAVSYWRSRKREKIKRCILIIFVICYELNCLFDIYFVCLHVRSTLWYTLIRINRREKSSREKYTLNPQIDLSWREEKRNIRKYRHSKIKSNILCFELDYFGDTNVLRIWYTNTKICLEYVLLLHFSFVEMHARYTPLHTVALQANHRSCFWMKQNSKKKRTINK